MKVRFVLFLLIPTALIGTAYAGWLRYQASACDTQTLFETASPDGLHLAKVSQTACSYGAGVGRDYYTVEIFRSGKKEDIFSIESIEPKTKWLGSANLSIFIERPAWILESKKQALGIEVQYEVPSIINHAALSRRIAGLQGLLDNKIVVPGEAVTPSSLHVIKQFDTWLMKVSAKDMGS